MLRCSSLFSAHIDNMEGKSSTQNAEIERFFKTFLPIENVRCVKKSVRCSMVLNLKTFLSPNYSKFAVECDWLRFLKTYEFWGFFEK